MKKIIAYLLEYQRKHLDSKVYGFLAVFLAICIFLNYRFDFENSYIDQYHGLPIKWVWMFFFQAFPHLVICVILVVFGKVQNCFSNPRFWLIFFLGFSILALDRSFYGWKLLQGEMPYREFYFIAKCLSWCSSLLTVVIPILILYYFIEKEDNPRIWYGLSFQKVDIRPYFIMLIIVGIIIGIGSFISDIKNYYPRINHSGIDYFLSQNDWPRWAAVMLYENFIWQ